MKLKISEEQFNRIFKPIYSAIFVDENYLKSKYKQVHPNAFYHHSTIEFKPQNIDNLPIGLKVKMKITGRLTTHKVDVLLVDNKMSTNENPHITLSTAEGVKPFESNSEIKLNLDKIQKISDTVYGVYGIHTNHGEITFMVKR